MLPVVASLLGVSRAAFSLNASDPKAGALKKIGLWLVDASNRRNALLTVWAAFVVLSIAFTALAVWLSGRFFHNAHFGVSISVIWWALFTGLAILFLLPAKAVTALFGGLIGISASETLSGNGLITRANDAIRSIAVSLKDFLADAGDYDDHFIRLMVKLFLVIVLVICLPAFFSGNNTQQSAQG
jgi:hypothetical protein